MVYPLLNLGKRMAAATVGPAIEDVATTRELSAMPLPSSARGNVRRTSAAFTLMMPAAPSPCSARAATSVDNEDESIAPTDAAVNSAMPTRYTRR